MGEAPPEDAPRSGRAGDEESVATPQPIGASGTFEQFDLSDRWGVLPPKEAEALQRRSVDEFPPRDRVWMERYFARVQRLAPER